MTPEQQEFVRRIPEIRERCNKATPGPWNPKAMFDRGNPDYIFPQYVTGIFTPEWEKNLEFIAHARIDLPDALSIIESQQQEITAHEKYRQIVTEEFADYERQIAALEQQLASANETIADYNEDYGNTLKEPCDNDDRQHCTCVPSLRRRINELEQQLAAAKQALSQITVADGWNAHHIASKALEEDK